MPSSGSESHDHQNASGGDGQQEHQPSHGSMGKRGVSRPMAEQEQGHDDHDHHEKQRHGGHGGMHEMSHEDRLSMLKMHHQQTLWVYWTIVLLGVWMCAVTKNRERVRNGIATVTGSVGAGVPQSA